MQSATQTKVLCIFFLTVACTVCADSVSITESLYGGALNEASETTFSFNQTTTVAAVGEGGSGNVNETIQMLLFQLPVRPSGGFQDSDTSLTLTLAPPPSTDVVTPGEHADLWAVGYIPAEDIGNVGANLNNGGVTDVDDFFLSETDTETKAGWNIGSDTTVKIWDNLADLSSSGTLTSSAAANTALTAFIDDLFLNHGATAGDYLLLRVNYDVNMTDYDNWVFYTGNASSGQPELMLTFITPPSPSLPVVVDNSIGPAAVSLTSATLRGELTDGGSASAWICWGASDGGATSTGNWNNVVALGTLMEGATFSAVATGLTTNATYWYRCFVSNSAGTAWSEYPQPFNGTVVHADAMWTPAQIDVQAWFDAADISTIHTNDAVDRVSQWDDKSGYNRHATNSAANQPTYHASDSMVGGRPTIGRDSAIGSYGLRAPSFGAKTAYAVCYYKDGLDSVFDNYETLFCGNLDSYAAYRVCGDQGNGNFRTAQSSHFNNAGTYKNGSASSSVTVLPMPASVFKLKSNTTRTQPFWLGYYQISDGRTWNGSYCEFIFTDGSESTDTQQKIEGYLAHKWGFADSLASGHPYKTQITILNLPPTNITSSSAALNGTLLVSFTNYAVYAHVGISDGGTNFGWSHGYEYVGSFTNNACTNATVNLSLAKSGLQTDTTYWYTFRASNDAGDVWASPSWTFTTLSGPSGGAVFRFR